MLGIILITMYNLDRFVTYIIMSLPYGSKLYFNICNTALYKTLVNYFE